ncbi:MAG: type IV toxin-antitoxin system AbiEi family antitoxin domain-containing protein [Actinomycetota bacterium]
MSSDGRVTSDRRAQVDHRGDWGEREGRLLALTRRQHGVVGFGQLRSLGISAAGVRHRVAVGRLHTLHRGVYALGRPDLPVEGHWMAAILVCRWGTLLSHISAAALHRLLSSTQTTIDVTIQRRAGLSRPGIRIHRSTCLSPVDHALVDGIPCTSVSRTLLDLAGVVHRRVLERACDQAEVLRVLDMNAVRELLARRAGQPGVRRLRRVLETGHVGEDIPRTVLEERFIRLCRAGELPIPEVNVWLALAGEEMQVDFLWRMHGVVVEVDGFATHGTRGAFQRDRRRDQLLSLAGWQVIRFTWDDVSNEQGHVMEVMHATLTSV